MITNEVCAVLCYLVINKIKMYKNAYKISGSKLPYNICIRRFNLDFLSGSMYKQHILPFPVDRYLQNLKGC